MTKSNTLKAQEITDMRAALRLTQHQLAALLGVSLQAVYYWETGLRDMPPTTVKLMKFFVKYPQTVKEF